MKDLIMKLMLVILIILFSLVGCKKKSTDTGSPDIPEQYKIKAEQEITEENMAEELQKIEQQIDADVNSAW